MSLLAPTGALPPLDEAQLGPVLGWDLTEKLLSNRKDGLSQLNYASYRPGHPPSCRWVVNLYLFGKTRSRSFSTEAAAGACLLLYHASSLQQCKHIIAVQTAYAPAQQLQDALRMQLFFRQTDELLCSKGVVGARRNCRWLLAMAQAVDDGTLPRLLPRVSLARPRPPGSPQTAWQRPQLSMEQRVQKRFEHHIVRGVGGRV